MAKLSVFLSGLLGVFAQVFILRALVAALGVNEFFLAVFLGLWIVFEGLGAWVFDKKIFWRQKWDETDLFACVVWVCGFLFVASLLVIPFFARRFAGVDFGAAVGFIDAIRVFAVFGGAVAFFHGAAFPIGSRIVQRWSGLVAGAPPPTGSRRGPQAGAGAGYVWETAGSLAGGALVWAVFCAGVRWAGGGLPPIGPPAAAAAAAFAAAVCAWFLAGRSVRQAGIAAILILAAAAAPAALSPGLRHKIFHYLTSSGAKGFTHIETRITPYQTLAVLRDLSRPSFSPSATTEINRSQFTIFSDGKPIFTYPETDTLFAEELIHYTSLLLPDSPSKIAIAGNPFYGLITTALKNRRVSEITFLEPDGSLIKILSRILPSEENLDFSRLKIIQSDAVKFLSEKSSYYDAIIINSPLPATLITNRLFTDEFFRIAYDALQSSAPACLTFHIQGSETFLNRETARLNLVILRSARRYFQEIYSLPAAGGLSQTNIYFCIKNPAAHLSADDILTHPIDREMILSRFPITDRKIDSPVVLPAYMYSRFSKINRISYDDALKRESIAVSPSEINSALRPIASFYAMQIENAQYAPRAYQILNFLSGIFTPAGAITMSALIILLAFTFRYILVAYSQRKVPLACAIRRRIIYFCMFAAGWTGMASMLMIMFLFEMTYGYIYGLIGLLSALFMAGSTVGSALSNCVVSGGNSPTDKACQENSYPTSSYTSKYLFYSLAAMTAYSIILAFLSAVVFLPSLIGKIPVPLYLIASFLAGFVSGLPYPLTLNLLDRLAVLSSANFSDAGDSPSFGGLYAAELAGGFASGFLSGIILLPVAGIPLTLIFAASVGISATAAFYFATSVPLR